MFTTEDILHCMKDYPGNFIGVFAINELPFVKRKPFALIINLDVRNLPGSHWVAVYGSERGGEVFDPLGQPTPSHIVRWLIKEFGDRWHANSIMYQDPTTVLCGPFCIWFLYKRSYYEDALKALSKTNTKANSRIVRKFMIDHFA